MSSYVAFNHSVLNNVVSMVSLYGFIHSEDAIQVFKEMSNNDFDLDFATMTKPDAEVLVRLSAMSDIFMLALQSENAMRTAFPDEIIAGVENINQKLKPFEQYIKGIATGSMSNAEVEHKLLSWGVKQHARLRRNSRKDLI